MNFKNRLTMPLNQLFMTSEGGVRIGVSGLSRFAKRHGMMRKRHRPRRRASPSGRNPGSSALLVLRESNRTVGR